MTEADALKALGALSQSTRLGILGLLADSGSNGMGSGRLAEALGIPRNLMSSHLAVLGSAGLVDVERSGRHANYSIRTDPVLALRDFLGELARRAGDAGLPAS